MAHLTPVRDAAGDIVGMRRPGDESQFAATLAETMGAVGGTPEVGGTVAPEGGDTPPAARPHLAMLVAGLVAALALVAGLNLMQGTPAATDQPTRALAAPTQAPAAPTGTPASTRAPTASPTALPTPEPPTPIVIVQPPIQCYTVEQDVTDSRGYPIGHVEGYSCESREAAQANADAQAEQVRATHEGR